MKEYKETVHIDGQVNEPAASYCRIIFRIRFARNGHSRVFR